MKKFMYEAPSTEVVEMEVEGGLMEVVSGGEVVNPGGGGEA